MPNLPPELITDILTRLPVKSLLRFKCVSKPWCCLIGSRDFMKMHLIQSHRTGSNFCLLLGFLGIYSIDLDSLDCASALRPPFSASDVSNSCNGLILVLSKESPFIWNPFTRKYKTLPSSPVEYPLDSEVRSAYETYGFVYDSEDDDYMVVRIVEFRGSNLNWIRSEAKVYSSNSNKWRKIANFPYQLPYRRMWGVHLNGALHTAVRDGTPGNFLPSIMAFDVRNEKHYPMPRPDFTGADVEFSLEILRDCLCLIRPRKKNQTDIWIMKEYGVKESWTKLLSIAPPAVEPYVTICPLAYSKNGEELLLNHDDKRLIWYNLRTQTVRSVAVNNLPFVFYAEVCIESLVHPDGCLGEAEDEQRQLKKRKERKLKEKRDDFLSEGFKLVL